MQTHFYCKEGETLALDMVLTGRDGKPQDLTSASGVTLTLADRDTLAVVVDRVACEFTAGASGVVSYESDDVIAFPGGKYYLLEVTVTFNDDTVHKFPNKESTLAYCSTKLA